MLEDQGPLAGINFGAAPVHYNPGFPLGNKGVDFETGILLKNFVEAKKPRQIVELGTFRGYSTSWLMLGTILNGMGRVDTFDVFQEKYYGDMWYDIYGLPKDNFTYHETPSGIWNFLDQVPQMIDLIFHDTEHLEGPTQIEMRLLLPRVPVGGIVLIDDMLHPDYKPMQGLLKHIFLYEEADSWKWSVLPFGHGLGIAERLK